MKKIIFYVFMLSPYVGFGAEIPSLKLLGAPSCKLFFIKKAVNIPESLLIAKNPGLKISLSRLRRQLIGSGQLKAPISMSSKMKEFRKDFLPLFKVSPDVRESVVRWMEAELRIHSREVKERFNSNKKDSSPAPLDPMAKRLGTNYDLIIVGGGVHGVLALHEALKNEPNLRILMVEKSDTIASNFRYPADSFVTNSSSLRSGENRTPLPGLGNLNELPGNPIQVSDLTAKKYPLANDFAAPLIAGMFAEIKSNPNVELLLSAEVSQVDYNGGFSNPFKYELELFLPSNKRAFVEVNGGAVIVATGLGKTSSARFTENFTPLEREMFLEPKYKNGRLAKMPLVVTFEEFMKHVAADNNPKRFFEKATIGIVGAGDSGKVVMEFFLGLSGNRAFGSSDSQTERAKSILWFGQNKKNCETFLGETRLRYSAIGSGFRSSAPDEAFPLITPVAQKVENVYVDYLMGGRDVLGVELKSKGDFLSDEVVDILIVASGTSNGESSNAFARFLGVDTADPRSFKAETEVIKGQTSVSNGEFVGVARVPSEAYTFDRDFYFVGPAAAGLVKASELLGVVQNSVSIFNNAPRVIEATKQLTEFISREAVFNPSKEFKTNPSLTFLKRVQTQAFIEGVVTPRTNDELSYIQMTLASALTRFNFPKSQSIKFVFSSRNNVVTFGSNIKKGKSFDRLLSSLLETRLFFGAIKELLVDSGQRRVVIELPASKPNAKLPVFSNMKIDLDLQYPAFLKNRAKIPVYENPRF